MIKQISDLARRRGMMRIVGKAGILERNPIHPITAMLDNPAKGRIGRSENGAVKAKQVITPSGKTRIKAEHDELQRIASEKGVSVLQLKGEIEG